MENSRERVMKAINRQQSDRMPFNLGGIYGFERWRERFKVTSEVELRTLLGCDLECARPVYIGPRLKEDKGIWGTPVDNVFGSDGAGYGEARGGYPLAEARTIAEIEEFPWPSADEFDYNVVTEVLAALPSTLALRVDCKYGLWKKDQPLARSQSGPWVPLICTLFDLFGLERALINFYENPGLMDAALSHISAFTLEFTRRAMLAGRGRAEILFYGDDFSTQQGMMLSPTLWRRFLLPVYRQVFAQAHSLGFKVWFHSCGSFRPVLGDLVDIGMDVWETVQAHLKGNEPEGLKRDFGTHLCFYGGVSTQHTLPHGSIEDVRREVHDRITVLGAGGGYIVGPDHGIMPDVPIDNVLTMAEETRNWIWDAESPGSAVFAGKEGA